MSTDQNITVEQAPDAPVTASSSVSWGLSTYMSIAIIIISAASAIYAGIKNNDTASVTAAATGLATALGAIASRTSQANTLTKTVGSLATAKVASQVSSPAAAIDATTNLVDHDAEDIIGEDLPTDEEEFAKAPDGDFDSAVHPDVPR